MKHFFKWRSSPLFPHGYALLSVLLGVSGCRGATARSNAQAAPAYGVSVARVLDVRAGTYSGPSVVRAGQANRKHRSRGQL